MTTCITLIGTGLWYLGAFIPIEFQKSKIGPFVFVYLQGKGPYHEVGPLFTRIQKILQTLSFQSFAKCKLAGIYYDDPKTTKTPRYAVGFIIENKKEIDQFESLEKDVWMKHDLKKMSLNETNTAVSNFPIRPKFMIGSFMMGVWKTYPAFRKQETFVLKCGTVEIYSDDNIAFHFPQDNTEQYLPSFS